MKEKKTLLMEFIHQKLRTLPGDPIRKGRAKGELIGFSRKKRAAAVLSLTNIPAKEIASLAKTKQSSVLIWRGKEDFQEAIEHYGNEFLELLKPHILKRTVDAYNYKPTPEQRASKEPTCPELTDGYLYSNKLRLLILKWALDIEDKRVSETALLLFGSNRTVIQFLNSTLTDRIQEIRKLLSGRLNKEGRDHIVSVLNLVERYLEMTKEG